MDESKSEDFLIESKEDDIPLDSELPYKIPEKISEVMTKLFFEDLTEVRGTQAIVDRFQPVKELFHEFPSFEKDCCEIMILYIFNNRNYHGGRGLRLSSLVFFTELSFLFPSICLYLLPQWQRFGTLQDYFELVHLYTDDLVSCGEKKFWIPLEPEYRNFSPQDVEQLFKDFQVTKKPFNATDELLLEYRSRISICMKIYILHFLKDILNTDLQLIEKLENLVNSPEAHSTNNNDTRSIYTMQSLLEEYLRVSNLVKFLPREGHLFTRACKKDFNYFLEILFSQETSSIHRKKLYRLSMQRITHFYENISIAKLVRFINLQTHEKEELDQQGNECIPSLQEALIRKKESILFKKTINETLASVGSSSPSSSSLEESLSEIHLSSLNRSLLEKCSKYLSNEVNEKLLQEENELRKGNRIFQNPFRIALRKQFLETFTWQDPNQIKQKRKKIENDNCPIFGDFWNNIILTGKFPSPEEEQGAIEPTEDFDQGLVEAKGSEDEQDENEKKKEILVRFKENDLYETIQLKGGRVRFPHEFVNRLITLKQKHNWCGDYQMFQFEWDYSREKLLHRYARSPSPWVPVLPVLPSNKPPAQVPSQPQQRNNTIQTQSKSTAPLNNNDPVDYEFYVNLFSIPEGENEKEEPVDEEEEDHEAYDIFGHLIDLFDDQVRPQHDRPVAEQVAADGDDNTFYLDELFAGYPAEEDRQEGLADLFGSLAAFVIPVQEEINLVEIEEEKWIFFANLFPLDPDPPGEIDPVEEIEAGVGGGSELFGDMFEWQWHPQQPQIAPDVLPEEEEEEEEELDLTGLFDDFEFEVPMQEKDEREVENDFGLSLFADPDDNNEIGTGNAQVGPAADTSESDRQRRQKEIQENIKQNKQIRLEKEIEAKSFNIFNLIPLVDQSRGNNLQTRTLTGLIATFIANISQNKTSCAHQALKYAVSPQFMGTEFTPQHENYPDNGPNWDEIFSKMSSFQTFSQGNIINQISAHFMSSMYVRKRLNIRPLYDFLLSHIVATCEKFIQRQSTTTTTMDDKSPEELLLEFHNAHQLIPDLLFLTKKSFKQFFRISIADFEEKILPDLLLQYSGKLKKFFPKEYQTNQYYEDVILPSLVPKFYFWNIHSYPSRYQPEQDTLMVKFLSGYSCSKFSSLLAGKYECLLRRSKAIPSKVNDGEESQPQTFSEVQENNQKISPFVAMRRVLLHPQYSSVLEALDNFTLKS